MAPPSLVPNLSNDIILGCLVPILGAGMLCRLRLASPVWYNSKEVWANVRHLSLSDVTPRNGQEWGLKQARAYFKYLTGVRTVRLYSFEQRSNLNEADYVALASIQLAHVTLLETNRVLEWSHLDEWVTRAPHLRTLRIDADVPRISQMAAVLRPFRLPFLEELSVTGLRTVFNDDDLAEAVEPFSCLAHLEIDNVELLTFLARKRCKPGTISHWDPVHEPGIHADFIVHQLPLLGLPIEKLRNGMDTELYWYNLARAGYFELVLKSSGMATREKALLCRKIFSTGSLEHICRGVEDLTLSVRWDHYLAYANGKLGDGEESITRLPIFRLSLLCQFWDDSLRVDITQVTETIQLVLPMLQEICAAAKNPAEYVNGIFLNGAYELIGLVCGDKYEWLQELKQERVFWKRLAEKAWGEWAWSNDDLRLHKCMRVYLQLAIEARGRDFVTAEPQLHAALAEIRPNTLDREWIRSYGLCQ